jgi:hypothetical protein
MRSSPGKTIIPFAFVWILRFQPASPGQELTFVPFDPLFAGFFVFFFRGDEGRAFHCVGFLAIRIKI